MEHVLLIFHNKIYLLIIAANNPTMPQPFQSSSLFGADFCSIVIE